MFELRLAENGDCLRQASIFRSNPSWNHRRHRSGLFGAKAQL